MTTRRAVLAALAASTLSACTPAKASPSIDGFVKIPANPGFAFTADVDNRSGAGEASAIASDYWIGQHLVTNAQYAAFAQATGRSGRPKYWSGGTYPAGKADHPVLFVSAGDATAYCAWLTGHASGWTFRLPTEAEWENAARGPQKYAYPWGNQAGTTYASGVLTSRYNYNAVVSAYYLNEHGGEVATYTKAGGSAAISAILSIGADGGVRGWIDHNTSTGFVYTDVFAKLSETGGYTTAVGAYENGKSAYGCYDLAGNAFEWTSSLITAKNGAEAGQQVNAVRGGSWYSTGRSCQTSYRGEGRAASGAYNTVGFRVAATRA